MHIALTGGIASGKSTVLTFFEQLGWLTFDADQVCHSLYKRKSDYLKSKMSNRWVGKDILDEFGELDRKKIAEIIFNNKSERAWLDSLFHPLVLDEVDKLQREHTHLIFDIPLLYEVKWENKFDSVICVWTDRATQLKFLMKRGFTTSEANKRINSQISPDLKMELADYAIINGFTINDLYEQIKRLDNILKEKVYCL
jgi:dephospho-CoA kinase